MLEHRFEVIQLVVRVLVEPVRADEVREVREEGRRLELRAKVVEGEGGEVVELEVLDGRRDECE